MQNKDINKSHVDIQALTSAGREHRLLPLENQLQKIVEKYGERNVKKFEACEDE
jgi:hypothetical protein